MRQRARSAPRPRPGTQTLAETWRWAPANFPDAVSIPGESLGQVDAQLREYVEGPRVL